MLDPKRVLLINVMKESDRKKEKINYEYIIEDYTSFSTNEVSLLLQYHLYYFTVSIRYIF